MANEEDPKQAARDEAKRPEVQRLLRQFLKVDGPKGNNSAYREGWERIFGGRTFTCPGCYCEFQYRCAACDVCADCHEPRVVYPHTLVRR